MAMSDVIISVENLGKCYRINHRQSGGNEGLRHLLNRWATAPLRALRAGRQNSETVTPHPSTSEDFWALRDVSFEIKRGEVLGIIGRNGAGKSTLLKILSRITEPTKGRVRIKGRVASLLEVGTGFHPELTGRENVYLNGAILGMSRAEIKSKFDEIIAFAEVEKFLDTPVKRYSSGMYVRLAFAVAAHLEPEILIVDEVLAVGDAQFQKKCLGKMQDVSRGGRTILFVSHQLGALKELCTSGILLSEGRSRYFPQVEGAIQEYLALYNSQTEQRKGIHISSIELRSKTKAGSSVFFGEPLEIKISLRDLPLHAIGVNLSIRNEFGRLLSLFSTNPHDGFSLPIQKEINVTFRMDFCCFAPSRYYLDVSVTEPAVRVIEELLNVGVLEVLPRRIGGPWPYEARYGDVFPQHTWRIGD